MLVECETYEYVTSVVMDSTRIVKGYWLIRHEIMYFISLIDVVVVKHFY